MSQNPLVLPTARDPWHRPGAKALIVHDGKVLVVIERLRNGRILHDFPGGGIEFGEKLQDALRREVFEEVGLRVEPVKVTGAWDFVIKHANVHIVCIAFQCRLAEAFVGEPKLDFNHNPATEDIIEARWLTPAEILADTKLFEQTEMYESVRQLTL